MQLYAPENAGKYVWQCADSKTRAVTYTANSSTSPPPDAAYGHPIGRYDSDGVFWTFCPNAGDEDPNSPRASRFAKHPHSEDDRRQAVKEKVWGKLSSMGSYKETEF